MSYTLEEYPTINLIADYLLRIKYEPEPEAIVEAIGLGLHSGFDLYGIKVFAEPLAAAIIYMCDNEYPEDLLEHFVSICEVAKLTTKRAEMDKTIDSLYEYHDTPSKDIFIKLIMHLFNYVFLVDINA